MLPTFPLWLCVFHKLLWWTSAVSHSFFPCRVVSDHPRPLTTLQVSPNQSGKTFNVSPPHSSLPHLPSHAHIVDPGCCGQQSTAALEAGFHPPHVGKPLNTLPWTAAVHRWFLLSFWGCEHSVWLHYMSASASSMHFTICFTGCMATTKTNIPRCFNIPQSHRFII